MLRKTTLNDLSAWNSLAAQVEHLFGKMVGVEQFQSAIKCCIQEGRSFCWVSDEGKIEGIVALDRTENSIAWLVVHQDARGKGIGRKLIEKALAELDQAKDVFVQTFSDDAHAGEAARKLYRSAGFTDFKDGGKNPAGLKTVVMKLEMGYKRDVG